MVINMRDIRYWLCTPFFNCFGQLVQLQSFVYFSINCGMWAVILHIFIHSWTTFTEVNPKLETHLTKCCSSSFNIYLLIWCRCIQLSTCLELVKEAHDGIVQAALDSSQWMLPVEWVEEKASELYIQQILPRHLSIFHFHLLLLLFWFTVSD